MVLMDPKLILQFFILQGESEGNSFYLDPMQLQIKNPNPLPPQLHDW